AVIVVSERWPDYLWIPVILWIAVTIAFVAWIFRDLRAHGIGIIARPALPGVVRVLGGTAMATVALIVVTFLYESLAWLWLIAYIVAIGALVAWSVRWQARHLAFRCDDCGTVFEAGAGTWTFSINMGDRK